MYKNRCDNFLQVELNAYLQLSHMIPFLDQKYDFDTKAAFREWGRDRLNCISRYHGCMGGTQSAFLDTEEGNNSTEEAQARAVSLHC